MQLDTEITDHFKGLKDSQKKALKKLGLETLEDLFFYFPLKYGSVAKVKNISNVTDGEDVALYGKLSKLETKKTFKGKVPVATGVVSDESGELDLTWFHQPYIAKTFKDGDLVKVQGKIGVYKGKPTLNNPEIEKIREIPTGVGNSLFSGEETAFAFPVYRETRGITSKWILHSIQKLFSKRFHEKISDPIPKEILKKYNLPNIQTALIWIHTPKKESNAISARKRFAFQEIFLIQIEKQKERKLYENNPSFKIDIDSENLQDFIDRFPFKPTESQFRAMETIVHDFKKDHAMSRLLEGDVGSGKTAVAAATAYAVTTTRPAGQNYGHLQTAYMAPTEILSEQHFQSFIQYFSYLNINIGLITSSGCKKFPSKVHPTKPTTISRSQLLKWVKNGEIPILIGTHSLIQKTVEFENLAYVIIDEQHRFGTRQRMKLRHKKDQIIPHLLSMTATPIPRTLALTIYGDLDLTLLDQMPEGRKPVETRIVLPENRNQTYEEIKNHLEVGRQMYVICPRIDEPDPDKNQTLNVKSVKEEAKRLQEEVFQNYKVGMLHGKMRPKEKEEVMNDFKDKKIDILVATSVVEVGVNVPNATIIIIEGAERFGLSQLHQLRGRVMRSTFQSYCFIFADSNTKKTTERLDAFKMAKNGFELAEKDLIQRGSGDLAGRKQWGISDLAMESLKNIKMVEAAREEAGKIVEFDFELNKFPEIKEHLAKRDVQVHFE